MKKIIILVIILLLTGCFNYKELSELSLVSSFILDKENEEFTIYINILDIEKDEKETTKTLTGKGKTIFEAARKINEKNHKILFNSNIDYILLSKNILIDSLDETIDYLSRDTHLPFNFLVMTYENIDDISSLDNLSKILKTSSERYGEVYKLDYKTLLNNYLSKRIDTLYPVVTKKDDTILIDKLAFIDKDDLIFLSKEEQLGFNIINNNSKYSVMTFKCKGGYFTLEILSSKTNMNVDKDLNIINNMNNKLVSYNCDYNINDIKNINILEEIASKEIESYMNKSLNKSTSYNKDYLGINDYLFKNKKDKTNITIKSKVKIIKEGNLRGDLIE